MRQQLYFASSKRSDGRPSDFSVILGNRVLTSKPGCTTRVMVTEASIPRTWYSFRQGANIFHVNPGNVPVIMPIGYLNAIDIRAALQTALPNGWNVTYSRITNRLQIFRPLDAVEAYTFDLTGFPREALGFDSDYVSFYNNSEFSDLPIRVNSQSAVLLHTDLQKGANGSMDNLYSQSFSESTVLAKIPVNAAPFDNITYSHEGEMQWQEVQQTHVDSLRIWLTDESGEPIDLPHDWSFTLVVEQEPRALTDTTLGDIRDILKLIALSDEKILRE